MQVEKAIKETFSQLEQVLVRLKEEEYTAQPDILNGASIGQHCRHLLEIYVCLNNGYNNGAVNYENRTRDKEIEQHTEAAQKCIQHIIVQLNKPEKELTLSASYSLENSDVEDYQTSYKRELAYALEHAVHHMALIRVGLKAVAPGLAVPENFGVASSTVKHRRTLSQ